MGAADSDIGQGGRRCPDIGTDLLGVSEIGPAVRVRDMGTDAAHKEGVGRIPLQGGLQADGADTTEGAGRRLGLTPAGGCHGIGRFSRGGDSCLHPK